MKWFGRSLVVAIFIALTLLAFEFHRTNALLSSGNQKLDILIEDAKEAKIKIDEAKLERVRAQQEKEMVKQENADAMSEWEEMNHDMKKILIHLGIE